MSLDTLLTKIKQTSAKKAADLEAEWWAAVKAVAAGKPVDAAKVADLLERIGKSGDDFAAAVQRHARRVELAATMAAGPDAERKKAEAEAAVAELNAEIEAAEKRYEDGCRPLAFAVRAAVVAITAADSAREELRNSCPHPQYRARVDAINRELNELAERKKVAERELEETRATTKIGHSPDRRSGEYTPHSKFTGTDYGPAITATKARLPEREKAVADLKAESERLVAEQERILEEMLIP